MLDQAIKTTPPRQRTGTLPYQPQLDGLRALAVLAVLYSNFANEGSISGFLGVRLSFVLSGYLISAILLGCREAIDRERATHESVFQSFFIRRGLRIYPAYYLALLLALVLKLPGLQPFFLIHAFFGSNLMFSFHHIYEPWFTAPLWTVCIEEQFYLIWPFVILLTPKRLLKPVVIAVILLGPATRLLIIALHKSDFSRFFFTTTAFDALGAGALLALVRDRRHWPRWMAFAAVVAGTVCVILRSSPRLSLPVGSQELIETLSLFPLVWIIAAASIGIPGLPGRLLSSPPLRYIGRISFGLYIYHAYIWAVLLHHTAHLPGSIRYTGLPLLLTGSILTFAFASLSWFAMELPANRLKARFPYRLGDRHRDE